MARSASSKNITHAYCHLRTDLNAPSGSQPATSGTLRRSATNAPAFTSAGVHEPSIAVALSREIRVSVLLATTLGSVLSSRITSFTGIFLPPMLMPPALLTSFTAVS